MEKCLYVAVKCLSELFFFRGFFFFSFLLVSAFGGKMIIMIGKDVLKMFFNLVASKEYYKIK